jgi:hypothetical protein
MVRISIANPTRAMRSTMPARLYVDDTLRRRLAENLEDMTAELVEFI